jgi:cytochrome c oxidase subunit 2
MSTNSVFSLLPEQASTFAGKVDALYLFLMAVSVFFTLLTAALVILFAAKYRRRSDADQPAPPHADNRIEIVCSAVLLVLVMVMFGWGASLFVKQSRPPAGAMEILVTGKQWMWKIQHPQGKREIDELHVPVGQPIRLTMTSEDVIHSFYVPAFRVKADVLPGRYTSLWFEPTKVGRYHLFCAEYCGTKHSGMIGSVVVMPQEDYQAWLGGGAAEGTLAQRGERLFTQLACVTCHAGGDSQRGPVLNGLYGSTVELASGETVKADADYIRESILNPTAKIVKGFAPIMPTFQGQVTEEQLLSLAEYIKALPPGKSAPGVNAAPAPTLEMRPRPEATPPGQRPP